MIKVKNEILNKQNLFNVFQKLSVSSVSVKTAYKIKRFGDFIDKQNKEYLKFQRMALEKYGELDEKGNPTMEFQGEGEERKAVGWKLKDGEGFKKAMDEFNAEEFNIEVTPLTVSDLDGVGITPSDMHILESFISDLS